MLEKAIEKIKLEVQTENKQEITILGDYVLEKLTANNCVKILEDDKSLKNFFKNLRNIAQKRAVDRCAVMDSTEILKMLDDYYELTAGDTAPSLSFSLADLMQ